MSFNLKFLRGSGAGIALSFVCACSQTAQGADLDESIRRLRMGTLVVEAAPGMEVRVEQVRHEFWFGAALASQMFGGRSGGENAVKYKQVFLDNFNAAVTENALKWHSMERRKGEVDYSFVEAILAWTAEHEIPLLVAAYQHGVKGVDGQRVLEVAGTHSPPMKLDHEFM